MTGRELALVSETVALPVSVEQAVQEWREYQSLTEQLLDPNDYQSIGQKRFKKKSAWRKYARAFNISDEVTLEEIHRDDRGFPLWARIRVRATAPNGRTAEADHECHVSERCCPNATEQACFKKGWQGHECCKPGCDGKSHWSHPGDLPATATTRAKNRAISDLIGAGEVSAEEMQGQKIEPDTARATTAPAARPQSDGEHFCTEHGVKFFKSPKMRNYAHPLESGGWHNEPEAREAAPEGEMTMREIPVDPGQAALDEAFGSANQEPTTAPERPLTASKVDYSANGLLDLGKQLGWTSNQVLGRIRQKFQSPSTSLPNFNDDERQEFAAEMLLLLTKAG